MRQARFVSDHLAGKQSFLITVGWDVSFSYLYDAKISSYRSDYLVHVGP